MLSDLVVSIKNLILIVDAGGQEKCAKNIMKGILRECQANRIKELTVNKSLKHTKTFERFLSQCQVNSNANYSITEGKWNVILPPLSDLLVYQPASLIFQFLHKLRTHAGVERIFFWISPQHILHRDAAFLVDCLYYMSDMVISFENETNLRIITRKSGGRVSNTNYHYKRLDQKLIIERKINAANSKVLTPALEVKEPAARTFRIELDEDEMVARNATALPYEQMDSGSGEIIYAPDPNDDIDAEDPDEDLDF